jgi:hypothetical protein
MQASTAQHDDACPSLMFAPLQDEEFADGTLPVTGVSFAMVRPNKSPAGIFVDQYSRSRPDWETFVNRLLDWADEAKRQGRERRADYLVSLAWEAYARMHPRNERECRERRQPARRPAGGDVAADLSR